MEIGDIQVDGSCFSTESSAKQGTSAFVHGVGSRDKQAWACYSEDEQKCVPCKLTVVNGAESLTLCWVDTSGKLVHYVPIHPLGSIKDIGVVNKSAQHTRSGHVFVVCVGKCTKQACASRGCQRETSACCIDFTMNAEEEHVITVEDCGACSLEVRKKSERALIDNTTKEYSPSSDYDDCDYEGFRLLCDAHVTAESVKVLVADLKEVERLLPSHALKLLQMDTPFYVNSSLEYGYRDEPTKGLHATFHPQGVPAGCVIMASPPLMKARSN